MSAKTQGRHQAAVTALSSLLGVLALALPVALISAPASAAGDPDYQRPAVGACHDYSAQASTKPDEPSAPVSCDGPHTAVTVAVITAPKRLSLRHKPSQQAALFRAIGRQCYAAQADALAATPRSLAKTAYGVNYFLPTNAELAHGARWVRCDLVLRAGHRLGALQNPPTTSGDDVRRCLAVRGGRTLTTVCAQSHNFRSTKVYTLHGKRFPGVHRLQSAARSHCALGRGVGYFATWPYAAEWNVTHRHQLVCYRQTAS